MDVRCILFLLIKHVKFHTKRSFLQDVILFISQIWTKGHARKFFCLKINLNPVKINKKNCSKSSHNHIQALLFYVKIIPLFFSRCQIYLGHDLKMQLLNKKRFFDTAIYQKNQNRFAVCAETAELEMVLKSWP